VILLTVGTQLPFDRFVRIVDEAAPALGVPIFAQIGNAEYEPVHMEWRRLVPPIEFDAMLGKATVIVSHAGVGTVVMAQKYSKPVILFPRRAALNEHRNDHQLATVAALEGRTGVYVARTPEDLIALLGSPLERPLSQAEFPSRDRLRNAVADYIRKG
jgi:UDP-N-acetylglucosamine transferase subunit ALG13